MNSARYLESLAQGFDPPGSHEQHQQNQYEYFQQQQQQQQSRVALEGYSHHNPDETSLLSPSNIAYDPTHNMMHTAANNHGASSDLSSQHTQQHHGLFMPGGLNHQAATMAAYLNVNVHQAPGITFPYAGGHSPGLQVPVHQAPAQQQQQQQQQQQSLVAAAAAHVSHQLGNHNRTNSNSNSNNFEAYDPLPLQTGLGHHDLHQYSFDDLLVLNPGILSGVELDPCPAPPTVSTNSSSTNNSFSNSNSTAPAELYSFPDLYSSSLQAPEQPYHNADAWLDHFSISVSGLSLEPLKGPEMLMRLRGKMDHVVTRYLPCVDFLVQCQQELRKGLTLATHKRVYGQRPYRDNMTPRQFYNAYIDLLPQKFYLKNQNVMEHAALTEAVRGLGKLKSEAKHMERHGCEQIKNTFLGGMKDGESWGLRKWLSKHGNALHVCTDVECVHQAVQKLDRSAAATRKFAEILRPMAQQALDRLKTDVPASYQERSTAHPYLPFFHRLESALRAMAIFDPDDDDVICIDDDDDDDEVEEVKPAPPPAKKRKARSTTVTHVDTVSPKRFSLACSLVQQADNTTNTNTNATQANGKNYESSSGESDNESVIEVVGVKTAETKTRTRTKPVKKTSTLEEDWKCFGCSILNQPNNSFCLGCGEEKDLLRDLIYSPNFDEIINVRDPAAFENDFSQHDNNSQKQQQQQYEAPSEDQRSAQESTSSSQPPAPPPLGLSPNDEQAASTAAFAMAENLDRLANLFDQDPNTAIRPAGIPQVSFWDGDQFAGALRIFSSLLRLPETRHFVDRVDEERLFRTGNPPFSHIIKHPLSFRDIVSALIQVPDDIGGDFPAGESGSLPVRGLAAWNMWRGADLLQAVDLVFLNILAYGKAVDEGKSLHRSRTNRLRKCLWNSINDLVVQQVGMDSERRKQCTPTRRSESSGFIVYKIRER
jgi:hypothetical protein